jgi:predicted RNA-binding protein with PIN domain
MGSSDDILTSLTSKTTPGSEISKEGSTPNDGPKKLAPLPSARLWLVDGYNALHCSPFLANVSSGQKPFWSNTMRERLVTLARRFPDRDAEIWLVFDGSRPAEDPERGDRPRVRLEFSPSADDWIVKRVRGEPSPATLAVVSGDRQLTGRARHHGAAVVSPRLFIEHCQANEAGEAGGRGPG